jgi:DNA-binding response OmpR family regulator
MKKILVLHANDTLRSRIGIMLQQEGFTPVWAVDGETGLDKIRALKPQLLLIDLPLAGISAVEL